MLADRQTGVLKLSKEIRLLYTEPVRPLETLKMTTFCLFGRVTLKSDLKTTMQATLDVGDFKLKAMSSALKLYYIEFVLMGVHALI